MTVALLVWKTTFGLIKYVLSFLKGLSHVIEKDNRLYGWIEHN
jgi:hypothetical protein